MMLTNPLFLNPHLVLDIGNTKIGGAIFVGERLQSKFRFNRDSHYWKNSLLEHVGGNPLSAALISSVVPSMNQELSLVLKEIKIPHQFVSDLQLDIEIQGKGAGNDRLADVYGMQKLYPGNGITIGIGTALVFNVVDEKTFYGGVIYPGMRMMARALAEQTAQLPLVAVRKNKKCCSQTTEGNISNGIYYGFLGAIEKIVKELKQECFPGKSVKVAMTGGIFSSEDDDSINLAKALEEDLSVIAHLEPDLTVIGLNEMFKRHFI